MIYSMDMESTEKQTFSLLSAFDCLLHMWTGGFETTRQSGLDERPGASAQGLIKPVCIDHLIQLS